MRKHRVLFDLATVFFGYSGIPQDTRMMFLSLCQASHQIDLTGLMSGIKAQVSQCRLKNPSNDPLKAIENLAYFVASLKLEPLPIASQYKVLKLLKKFQLKANLVLRYFKSNYDLYPYHDQFLDFIWKSGFKGAVSSEFQKVVLKQNFVASNFSKHFLKLALVGPFPLPSLNTKGYDFVIFQDGTPGCPRVSKGTIPIVRYYDAVPLVCSDTIANPEIGPTLHASGIREAQKQGAYFACDSYPVEVELLKLAPELEGRTFVVPVSVTADKSLPSIDSRLVKRIVVEHHVSNASSNALSDVSGYVAAQVLSEGMIDHYIMSVATLEPRKNFLTLISAFEKIRLTKDPDLKLIIVGSPGWQCGEILDAMKPHIEAGRLFHLQKVPDWELKILYANARAFVFPSYYEGFGITPVEASLAGCPTIVSDIPVHRWVMGESALYCNPHDMDSISDAIDQLLYAQDYKAQVEHLKKKATKNGERFSLETVSAHWVTAFERLKLRA